MMMLDSVAILVTTLLLTFFIMSSKSTSATTAATTSPPPPRPVAIITGGTRGIGSGISSALADAGYDLLLTYNTNTKAAEEYARTITLEEGCCCRVECVGGDISLAETRDKVFACLDSKFPQQPLKAVVHNAGQYVGITADNVDGLEGDKPLAFGDGSLLDGNGRTDFSTMHYYQRMYGEAFVDLCERALVRMDGGSIIGISSPGVTASLYSPQPTYSMPGSGKCLMEYSMRIYALKAAEKNVNVNVIVPGVTRTGAWNKLAKKRGLDDEEELMQGLADRYPMKAIISPRDIGNVAAFLCSSSGRYVTGHVMPVDGGLHLK